jgi:hypothetical protein
LKPPTRSSLWNVSLDFFPSESGRLTFPRERALFLRCRSLMKTRSVPRKCQASHT